MHDYIHMAAEYIALFVNIVAVLAIGFGAAQASVRLLPSLMKGSEEALTPVWLDFGRWLVAGLTFQLAADIIESAIAPNWEDIGKLGAIAAIRTFLSYFLDRDMDNLRRRRERYQASSIRVGEEAS